MKKQFITYALLLFTVCAAAQTSKADPTDVQGWYNLGVKFNLPKKWSMELEYQTRFINNLSDYNGSYISVTGKRKITKKLDGIGEYRLAMLPAGTYHRFTVGASYTEKLKPVELGFRLLVQNQLQDFVDPTEPNDQDAYWRFRVQLSYPFSKKVEGYVSTEPVMKFGGNHFVNNWRNTIGFQFKVLKNTKLDFHYIYRPDYAKRTYNRYFHIIGLGLEYAVPKKKKN